MIDDSPGSPDMKKWEADQLTADTKVFVDHTIMFHLSDAERFVVPRRSAKGYVSVGYVTVHLFGDRRSQITASGNVCKKDGTPSAVTRMNESVTLPDEAQWVERARRQLIVTSL